MLVQNLDRLDENVKEEADGVHNTLGTIIIENNGTPEFITAGVLCFEQLFFLCSYTAKDSDGAV